MKILVTGGNGFLGSWVVRRLAQNGHDVRVLHRKQSDLSALKNIPFQSRIGDVTDLESVKQGAQGAECLFHVAGLVSYSPADYDQMFKVNVNGTQNVVDACLAEGCGRLVNTSSVVSVGASASKILLNEES